LRKIGKLGPEDVAVDDEELGVLGEVAGFGRRLRGVWWAKWA